MNTKMQTLRTKLSQLVQEREMLRTQYGRHSSRSRILDKDIRAAVQAYQAERRVMLHHTLREMKTQWNKRLGWDDADWKE